MSGARPERTSSAVARFAPEKFAPEKFAPPVVTDVVDRPRLLPAPAPVTVVAATAGWGKTIFAASWLETADARNGAWVSLDEGDDDPRAFWSAVATGLMPIVGQRAAEALRKVAAGAVDVDDLPAAVVAALRLASGPVSLVLDNLHEIRCPRVHEALVRLAERPPPWSLLVTTRRDPPWPLTRLRLAGLVAEVRAADLAFRVDEAAELLARLGVGVTAAQLEQLVERTEGWPAGLRLVALHLAAVSGAAVGERAAGDLDAAVRAFSGQDHSVAGYLLTEVLDRESPETITFLETISVVDLVCGDLADSLTGRGDGSRVLADLAASHLFVQAVGRPGRWYRLHRLIADILRSRPAPRRERRDLHRRAAEWFRAHDMPLDALRSAVDGGLWPFAAELAGTRGLELVLAGRARAVDATLTRVPRVALGAHPQLAGSLALARVAMGVDTEVATLIDLGRAARATVAARRSARAGVLLDLAASGLARIAGDWEEALAAYRSVPLDPAALAALGMARSEAVPVIVANNRGTAALWAGDLDAAQRQLSAATGIHLEGVAISQLNAFAYHALLRCDRGELDLAEAEALRVVDAAVEAGLEQTVQCVGAYLALARVVLDRGGADEADRWLDRIADVVALGAEPHVRLAAAVVLAARREAVGEREAALVALSAPGDLADWCPPTGLRERWMAAEAALLARTGRSAAARDVLARVGRPTGDEGLLAVAQVHLLLGDLPEAAAARACAVAAPHVRSHVAGGVLDAQLAATAGDADLALDRLEDALVAAAPRSLRRPFLAEAAAVRPLLARRVEIGSGAAPFALDLLERMSASSPGGAATAPALTDPLTGRERTVLRYLASSLSNAEIAAELYLSVSTVKTHQRSLYRKLGATGRRDAVKRARLLREL